MLEDKIANDLLRCRSADRNEDLAIGSDTEGESAAATGAPDSNLPVTDSQKLHHQRLALVATGELGLVDNDHTHLVGIGHHTTLAATGDLTHEQIELLSHDKLSADTPC